MQMYFLVVFAIGRVWWICMFFFFQAEDGIRDGHVTGVQTCALPIYAWSDALAGRGLYSPDEDVDTAKLVELRDVNRIAKEYLTDANSISATLIPVPGGEAVSQKGFGQTEQVTSPPTRTVELPEWASSRLMALELPPTAPLPVETVLPNGIRL